MKGRNHHIFFPQPLKKEKLFPASFLTLKKKEAELEFFSLNFSKEYSSSDLLRMPQNRFLLYSNKPFMNPLSYAFYFKSFDKLTKSFLFATRKKKLSSFSSVSNKLLLDKELNFSRGRTLSTFDGGYKLSVMGCPGKMSNKNLLKKFTLKKRTFSLFPFLSSYGQLTYFYPFSKGVLKHKKYEPKKKKRLVVKKENNLLKKKISSFSLYTKQKKNFLISFINEKKF